MSSNNDKNSTPTANNQGTEVRLWVVKGPLVPIGIAGCLVALLFSAYTFRKKGIPNSPKKVYLDSSRSRNAARGIVSALTIGAFYYRFHELMDEKKGK